MPFTDIDMTDLMAKPIWTITDICLWLNISRDTLERWRRHGSFPAPRVMPGGHALRWNRLEVVAWFDALEREAA